MTMSSNAVGVACCGNCGSVLEIRCKGGCPEPDVIPRENYVASLPKPMGRAAVAYKKGDAKVVKYPPPTACKKCGGELPPYVRGVGRPPAFCLQHRQKQSRSKAAT